MRNIALKYALKLIFLKFMFEFMINTDPPASNSVFQVFGRLKYGFDTTKLIFQIMCVTVVQWLRSFLHLQVNRVRLPVTLFSVSLYRFFFNGLFFLTLFFLLAFFFFILTADPAGHALGSIYTLSLSPDFYFGKGISKALDLHTGLAYDQVKTISCQYMSLL